jgi:hypothetical protein
MELILAGVRIQEPLHSEQRFIAAVVLDTLGIRLGRGLLDTESEQKVMHKRMSLFRPVGQSLTLFGQKNGSIRLGGDQTFPLQALDSFAHADLTYSKSLGKVHRSGLSGIANQLLYELDVVLGSFFGMIVARALEFVGHCELGIIVSDSAVC